MFGDTFSQTDLNGAQAICGDNQGCMFDYIALGQDVEVANNTRIIQESTQLEIVQAGKENVIFRQCQTSAIKQNSSAFSNLDFSVMILIFTKFHAVAVNLLLSY